MTSPRFDIAIVGGGIVGLATAHAIASRYACALLLIEAEPRLAQHQTGNNSGVIHSGLYYKPGSLKARNCVEGREALYRFCAEHGVRHERCGKLVVALAESELPAMDELQRRGNANGLQGVRRLSGPELLEYEPHVAGVAGLWVPETGIVDYVAVAQTYARLAEGFGARIQTSTGLRSMTCRGEGLVLETTQGSFLARNLINCAGLQSDRVARLCGVDPQVRIVPFRGEYYQLIPERQHLVRNLIYPVPDPRFPFLGVHFTRMIQGGVEAGPNAVLAMKRYGYTRGSFSLRDSLDMIRYGGFWRMSGRYWRTGLGELHRSWSRRAFHRALARLIPDLRYSDIRPAGAGVRAQALTAAGQLVDDFHIVPAERMIHVLNAPSPAATASLAIGASIAALAADAFTLPAR